MKKRIINGLILAVSFVAVAGMFTSCKDTYQDFRTDFQSQIDYQASVSETLKNQIATLNNQVATLEALQKECKETCAQKFNEMNTKINNLQALVEKVKADSETADANLQAQITNLVNEIAFQQGEIDDLKDEIAALKAQDALFQNAINTINGTITEVKEQVATNTKGIADLVTAVAAVNKAAADAAALAQEALNLANKNKTDIATLQEAVNTINGTIAGWGDRLTAVEKEAATAKAKAMANEARIAALEDLTTKQAEAIANLKSSLENLTTTVSTLSTTVNGLRGSVTALEGTVATMAQKMAEAETLIAAYAVQFAQALQDIAAAQTLAEKADALAAEAKGLAEEALTKAEKATAKAEEALAKNDALDTKLKAVENAFAAAEQEIQTAIGKLQSDIEALTSQISTLASQFQKAYNELITSIVIQGTWNPLFGEVTAPLDIRSNVLVALYGNAVNDVYFPTDKPSCYVDADEVPTFTEGDIEILNGFNTYWFDAQDVVINDEEGNAGTLYMTVNPSSVDFTGTQFSLVNSLDEESGVKLSVLKPSDHLLTFGWTRAENGFYEAKATVSADDVENVKVVFDLEKTKGIARELRKVTSGISKVNYTDIFSTLQDELSAILEADGVKATWTDAITGQQKSVYSQYGIAATAIKPLSFAFLKDWNAPKLPHISPFDYTIDMKLDSADYKDVPYSELTVQIDTDGDDIYETYTIQGVNDLIDNINKNVGGSLVTNVDHLIDQLAEQVNNNVDKAINTVNGKVINRVNSLIDKLNSRISNINHYLQPCLIYQTNEGTYFQTSTTWFAPTHFTLDGAGEQAILLTPTSYTAELLAPAFKKLVAVTNVYNANYTTSAQEGDAICLAALEKANSAEGMNVLFSGAVDILFLTDSAYANCVYEILYTAVDYSGKVVANKYYVKVVE